MSVAFIDVELCKDLRYPDTRMVQLSYIICNENFEKIRQVTKIVRVGKGTEFKCDEDKKHLFKITKEVCDSQGEDLKNILNEFKNDIEQCKYVVAHNMMSFDYRILKKEMENVQVTDFLESKTLVCSLKNTTHIVRAKNESGSIKKPSLTQLYEFATGKDMMDDSSHLADYDTECLREAYSCLLSSGKVNFDSLMKDAKSTTLKNEKLGLTEEEIKVKLEDLKKQSFDYVVRSRKEYTMDVLMQIGKHLNIPVNKKLGKREISNRILEQLQPSTYDTSEEESSDYLGDEGVYDDDPFGMCSDLEPSYDDRGNIRGMIKD